MATEILYAGDTSIATIVIEDGVGPFNLAGCTVWYTLKPESCLTSDGDDCAIAHVVTVIDADGMFETEGGEAVVTPLAGRVVFQFQVENPSNGITTNRVGHRWENSDVAARYDVQVKDSYGRVRTVAFGNVRVRRDASRASTV